MEDVDQNFHTFLIVVHMLKSKSASGIDPSALLEIYLFILLLTAVLFFF
jgi:hypothetical protein